MALPSDPQPRESGTPLTEASPDDLRACVRLLAMWLEEYRARFGVVPLKSVEPKDSKGTEVLDTAAVTATIAEALAIVRRMRVSGESTAKVQARPREDGEDLRRQYRININVPVTLASGDQTQQVAAVLRNISWGGALVRGTRLPANIGDTVWLRLPVGRGKQIPVRAVVLREQEEGGMRDLALRFDSISPADEPQFRHVLEVLLAQPDQDGRRSEPRLVQRLEIEYGESGELRATLEDISAGGLMLTLPDPLEVQQSLLIVLSSSDSPHTIELRARVVHQNCIPGKGIDLYRVGFAFEYPDDELRARIATLIRQLVTDQTRLRMKAKPIDPE